MFQAMTGEDFLVEIAIIASYGLLALLFIGVTTWIIRKIKFACPQTFMTRYHWHSICVKHWKLSPTRNENDFRAALQEYFQHLSAKGTMEQTPAEIEDYRALKFLMKEKDNKEARAEELQHLNILKQYWTGEIMSAEDESSPAHSAVGDPTEE